MSAGTQERPGPDAAGPAPPRLTARPPGRPSAVRELALGLAVFAVYALATGRDASARSATARAHAYDVLGLERALHLDVEGPLNRWLAPQPVLRVLANYEYATTYVLSAFLLLLWLWLRRPEVYRWARSSFVLLNVAAIACFELWPLMPPRLLPPSEGFVDTVLLGRTWGSWGSPLVGHANQLAAMPSLHFGWAIWVSVVLARTSGGRRTQLVSGVHVLVTLWVVLATANHFLLDAVAATVLVVACVAVCGRARPTGEGGAVPAADAFFLHVERPGAAQQVGGVVLLDVAGRPGDRLGRAQVEAVVRERLGDLPRFRQLLVEGGRWRRPRWRRLPAAELDWSWHVPVVDLGDRSGPGGRAALDALVGRLAETSLPRDRPLWRLVVVEGVGPGVAAVVLVVHHVVADGIGTVAQALRLLDPQLPPPADAPRPPGRPRTALAAAVGLAQLATDGRAGPALPSSAGRRFGTAELPLEQVRAAARAAGARVSDVLLTLVAEGLRRALLREGTAPPERLRVSVPLTLRDPRTAAEGNVTAAVFVDLPLGPMTLAQRLVVVARRSARLRTPTRAVASRLAMRVAGALPPPLHARFARSVYGPRYFSGIVSNMPGPDRQLSLTGAALRAAFPLLPLAPDVPLAVGSLGWNGVLCVGLVVDPALLPDPGALGADLVAALVELHDPAPAPG